MNSKQYNTSHWNKLQLFSKLKLLFIPISRIIPEIGVCHLDYLEAGQ